MEGERFVLIDEGGKGLLRRWVWRRHCQTVSLHHDHRKQWK